MMAGPPPLFDRAVLDDRRRRALARPHEGVEFLLRTAVEDLADRLAAVQRSFPTVVDLATPLPLLADRASSIPSVGRVIRFDRLRETVGGGRPGIVGEPELLPFRQGSLDLVMSALALQWIDDLPGTLAQIRRALKPDGLFIANLIGGESLHELRESFAVAEAELSGGASPRVSPFPELRALGALMQRAGFALPVVDQDRMTVRYDSALELMRDLRAMGASNALIERSRRPLRRDVLFRAAAVYAERFADPDGRIRASFDVVSLSGWVPHESQQQPLLPGSARARLAEALGVAERSAGEKAGR